MHHKPSQNVWYLSILYDLVMQILYVDYGLRPFVHHYVYATA